MLYNKKMTTKQNKKIKIIYLYIGDYKKFIHYLFKIYIYTYKYSI